MLKREEVIQAIDLHQRSYNLLLWLSAAVSKGLIRFDRAHDYMDEAEAAEDWIKGHYDNLPANCRPKRDQLPAFARFFATYLTTSFDLVKRPGQQLTSQCGCYCPLCAYLVAAPNLKTKKLWRRDKERARKIKITALEQLSGEHNAHLDREQVEKLIDSESAARDAALLAYGQQLVARTHGQSQGPAVLALWREIAWDKGSPKKGFELETEEILRAEQSLTNAITVAKQAQ
jgi:hypothetical protein